MIGNYGDYGHSVVAWNRRGLGLLGDDSATFLGIGFNSLQIQQIVQAHQSGALSDAGYQALVSGFISPDDLSDFLAADPGAPQSVAAPRPGTTVAPTSPNIQLAPGATPRVAYTSTSFFTQSSLLSGVPNWAVMAGAVVLASVLGGSLKGRR
jgi:hypothetical protein